MLDPASGSAHFLVAVMDELADHVARLLARTPLPATRSALEELRAGAGATFAVGADGVPRLRRLALKRLYGVDRSAMGADIAKVSRWLEALVPGLALGYLDHNVEVGDSLVASRSPEHPAHAGPDGSFRLALRARGTRRAVNPMDRAAGYDLDRRSSRCSTSVLG